MTLDDLADRVDAILRKLTEGYRIDRESMFDARMDLLTLIGDVMSERNKARGEKS